MGEELNKDGEHSSEAIADNMGNVNTGSASPVVSITTFAQIASRPDLF